MPIRHSLRFTEGVSQAEPFLELGFDIGVTGWMTGLERPATSRRSSRSSPRQWRNSRAST
jgi:hypothetical protein